MTPRKIRTYHDVAAPEDEDVVSQVGAQHRRLEARMEGIGRVVAVASGKGGVGKSAVAANLAAAMAAAGSRAGALDADLNGPSLARMLGAAGPLKVTTNGVEPAVGAGDVRVVSTALLLDSPDAPVRWHGGDWGAGMARGVLETGALREMLADVAWDALDVLVVDLPPGTDRLERLLGLVSPDLLLVVTTPSAMAAEVVGRSLRAAREAGVEAPGLVANMTTWACPHCGEASDPWGADGARALAESAGVELWAEIPFDPALARATDAGRPIVLEDPDRPSARALTRLADRARGER